MVPGGNASDDRCLPSEKSLKVFSAWMIVYLLVLPIFASIVYVGFWRWKTRFPHTSHSDVFTYHMVALELLNSLGSSLYLAGFVKQYLGVVHWGLSLKHLASVGEMSLHSLTCMECYLAVVHPIAYLHLKKRGGVMIRNFSISGTWLFGAISTAPVLLSAEIINEPLVVGFGAAVLCTALVSFCSVSVLCVLIRPGPEDGGAVKEVRIDQSKSTAVYTMLFILGALPLKLAAVCFYYGVTLQAQVQLCVAVVSTFWVSMPSSFVLPLLFLHRHNRATRGRGPRGPTGHRST